MAFAQHPRRERSEPGGASPDSLIPDPFSPQSLNRYGYVLNNPLGYTDPTGHRACDDRWGCEGPPPPRPAPPPQYGSLFRVQDPPSSAPPLTPTQTDQLRDTATQAVELQAEFLAPLVGGSPEEAFEAVLGSFAITIDPAADVRGTCITEYPLITCEEVPPVQTLLHELSHIFDVRYRTLSGDSHLASDYLPRLVVGDTEMRFTSGGPVRTDWGYICEDVPCQASQVDSLSEEFADSYMNYLLDPMGFPQNGFTEDDYGQARRDEFLDLMRNRWLPDMGFAVIPE